MNLKKFIVLVFVVGIALYGGYKLNEKETMIEIREVERKVIIDNLGIKIDELKDSMLDDLKSCESGGYSEDDGILIYDTNKEVSIGQYQFQKKTVIYYYKTIYSKNITGKDAVIIALNTEEARQLASDIIFKTDKGLSNWYNCTKKHNLQGRLDIIRQLETPVNPEK